jgi:beta-galactosidase
MTIVDATNVVVQTMTASGSIAAGATYTFEQTGTVTNPHLWSPEVPYRYTVYSVVQDGSTFVDSYKFNSYRTIKGFREACLKQKKVLKTIC